MKLFKQFTLSLLAFAAAGAASAANQPVTATSAKVTLDTAYLSANGYTVAGVGSATYNSATGVLTDPVASVSTAANPGAATVTFASGSGLTLTANGTTVKLFDFSYDAATNSLFGAISSGLFFNLPNQSLLTASTVAGDFGGSSLTSVPTSGSTRTLNLAASNFSLSTSFQSFLTANGVSPSSVSFVASLVKSVNIGTVAAVPEPSTYALMGLGLVGIAFAARRKQA